MRDLASNEEKIVSGGLGLPVDDPDFPNPQTLSNNACYQTVNTSSPATALPPDDPVMGNPTPPDIIVFP
jgi:hypothetical protein